MGEDEQRGPCKTICVSLLYYMWHKDILGYKFFSFSFELSPLAFALDLRGDGVHVPLAFCVGVYKIAMSQDDVERSTILYAWCMRVLDSKMENSLWCLLSIWPVLKNIQTHIDCEKHGCVSQINFGLCQTKKNCPKFLFHYITWSIETNLQASWLASNNGSGRLSKSLI